MIFRGTISSINTALNGLLFSPTANFNGKAGVAIGVNDLGNTGSGGALTTSGVVSIQFGSVNDAPSGGKNQFVSTNKNKDYVFKKKDFGFTDANDSPANNFLAVYITSLPSVGTLYLNGVAVSSGDYIKVSDIVAGKFVYSPPANTTGSPLTDFLFQVQDDGGTANGGVDLDPFPKKMTIFVV
jgi:hypothetical protein